MGRLSVVLGLSIKVRPVTFMAFGRMRVASVRGMS